MLEAVLDLALENADDVLSTIEDSVDDFINGEHDIIMTDYQPEVNRTFTMVDIRNGSLA